jgi:hypothetical protein
MTAVGKVTAVVCALVVVCLAPSFWEPAGLVFLAPSLLVFPWLAHRRFVRREMRRELHKIMDRERS